MITGSKMQSVSFIFIQEDLSSVSFFFDGGFTFMEGHLHRDSCMLEDVRVWRDGGYHKTHCFKPEYMASVIKAIGNELLLLIL